ncbi:hypothetical protein MTR_5g045060 [Medicago truncatula]|uniref:Uncharacterized protein n=1 Tax=Medicago truncatula TaxID=3880 RepID=G7JY26_MEDTR|nr:hypothetical protein MTR_5g045060 [Medicago truncatula]
MCRLSKSIDNFGPIENNSVNKDPSYFVSETNAASHNDSLSKSSKFYRMSLIRLIKLRIRPKRRVTLKHSCRRQQYPIHHCHVLQKVFELLRQVREGNNLTGFDLNKLPVVEFDYSSKEPNTIQVPRQYTFASLLDEDNHFAEEQILADLKFTFPKYIHPYPPI